VNPEHGTWLAVTVAMQSVTKRLWRAPCSGIDTSNERGFAMSLFDLLGSTLSGVVGIVGGFLSGLGGILF
jgi:hypothetical protein